MHDTLLPIVLDGEPIPPELGHYLHIENDRRSPNFVNVLSVLGNLRKENDETIILDRNDISRVDIRSLKDAHAEGTLTLVCGAGVSIGAKVYGGVIESNEIQRATIPSDA